MFNVIKKEIVWGGKNLSIETGKIGRQASSVIARMGDTVVMANVTTASKETTGIDFTPLTITYIEKFYAAGQIPPGFVKRESKPSDQEILIARLIDRPIRPLFPSNYRYETNVFCTLLSYDASVPVEVVASIAASAALTISKASLITCADKTGPKPASTPVSDRPRFIPFTPGKSKRFNAALYNLSFFSFELSSKSMRVPKNSLTLLYAFANSGVFDFLRRNMLIKK